MRISLSVTTPPIFSPVSPGSPRPGSDGNSIRGLSLLSPMAKKSYNRSLPKTPDSSAQVESSPHAYRRPGPSDSRCPCPALNTLANHGYLPRDGRNIQLQDLIAALQHPKTFHLSTSLAEVLAKGGAIMTEQSLMSLLPIIHEDETLESLQELSRHDRFGVEHSASVVHKNVANGHQYAPTRTDTPPLNDFLRDRPSIDITDIACRRVALERVSPLGLVHAEIARGEWAIVLGVFGHAHGGKIPTGALRTWLYENRFPDKWEPDHKQGLKETLETSLKIRSAMDELRRNSQCEEWSSEDARLARLLETERQEQSSVVVTLHQS